MHAQQVISFAVFILAVIACSFTAVVSGAPAAELETRGGSSITWYGGSMLNNPACGGSTPSSGSMIGAVKQGGRFRCGNHLKIHYQGKQVTVRVVDYCGGCGSGDVDLTKGAFQKLAPLSKGRLSASVAKM